MKWLDNVRDQWFPKPKPLSALDAYTITKYGLALNDDALHKKALEEIESLMQAKSARGSYSLVFALDENVPELGIYLNRYYSDLGFNSFILDSSIDSRIEIPELYISWKVKSC